MNTKSCKQDPRKTINPLRCPLIAPAHRWQGKNTGNQGEPDKGLNDNQQKQSPAFTRVNIITHKQ